VDAGLITIPKTASGAAPILVVFERNPWLMSVGSDFPSVVVYEDGRMIFVQEEGRQARVIRGSQPPFETSSSHVDLRSSQWKPIARTRLIKSPSRSSCALAHLGKWRRRMALEETGDAESLRRKRLSMATPPCRDCDRPTRSRLSRRNSRSRFGASSTPRVSHCRGQARFRLRRSPWCLRNTVHTLPSPMTTSSPPRAMLLNGHKWTVVPRWLWPGYAIIEDVVRCAHIARWKGRPAE